MNKKLILLPILFLIFLIPSHAQAASECDNLAANKKQLNAKKAQLLSKQKEILVNINRLRPVRQSQALYLKELTKSLRREKDRSKRIKLIKELSNASKRLSLTTARIQLSQISLAKTAVAIKTINSKIVLITKRELALGCGVVTIR
jgi:hypothetical protein